MDPLLTIPSCRLIPWRHSQLLHYILFLHSTHVPLKSTCQFYTLVQYDTMFLTLRKYHCGQVSLKYYIWWYLLVICNLLLPEKDHARVGYFWRILVTIDQDKQEVLSYHQYIKDYKVEICRGEGRQSTVRGSTVNSEVIDNQHCWLLILGGGGSTVNSERVNIQQWGNWQSTVNSERVDGQQWGDQWSMVYSERVNSQQWGDWWSTVNSEAIDDQHCCLLIWGVLTIDTERINSQLHCGYIMMHHG